MRLTIFSWLNRDFIGLTGEGNPELGAAEATRDLLARFDALLRTQGLSLDNTVRTRLFARDRPSREQGSAARRQLLSSKARGSSSSFVAPGLFDSRAVVALDLLAMRPGHPGAEKTVQDYDPPRAPLRYLIYDSVVFLSGVTSGQAALEAQVAEALAEIGESLAHAGSSWERAVLVSCFLHSSQNVSTLRQLLRQSVPGGSTRLECEFVEGYASEGCLIEVEVTAVL
jgi:enamine deaminase RidA (YjgF/YER057c/UK114 family)